MSDLFNIYEDNLNLFMDRIKKINETFKNLSKEKAEYAIKDGNNCIKEANKILKQMEIELSTVSSKQANNFGMKLRNYNNELDIIKNTFMKIQENYINKKSEEALILGTDSIRVGGGHQNHRLIENEQSVWRPNDKLEKAKRSAVEVESVSVEVMRQLDNQTNQMKIIGSKVNNMNNNIDESNSLLNKIMRMENRNKLIASIFFTLIILVILSLLFFKML